MCRMIVYTAVFGGYDTVRPPADAGNARWVCVTDGPDAPEPWETVRVPTSRVGDPRLLARTYKIRSHRWFPHGVVIWHDGNVQLKVAPEMLEQYIEAADIAVVEHTRKHHYAEAHQCLRESRGDPQRIHEQVVAYYEDGCPPRPVGATFLMIRRQTPAVVALNEMWWQQVERYSCRDQISLPYCIWKLGMKMATIPGHHGEGPDYWRHAHD